MTIRETTGADVAVIGAGFGGLAAALRLSELGAKVVVLETLSYPGGCAGTFRRHGYEFEAGATLCSGLGPGQLFHRYIERYGLDVETEDLDPVVELRTPQERVAVPADRDRFLASFLLRPGAPVAELTRFFATQGQVADLLWRLFDRHELLPPFGLPELCEHARRGRDYLRVAPLVGRTLGSMLRRYGLDRYEPLRVYLDALCQITVQCPANEAEALFALAAMDYYFRGTKHVRGGLGALAWALAGAIRKLGGEVRFANRVSRLSREQGVWRIETRRGEIVAPRVVANLLPQTLEKLAGIERGGSPALERLSRSVSEGWGAAMIYRVVRAPDRASARASHLALVRDTAAPFIEGNHVFCSFSSESDGRSTAPGFRTVTVSTHVRPGFSDSKAAQASMRETLRALAPEWEEEVVLEMTASPRTFERFTGRVHGFVGGIPRRAGFHNYRRMVCPQLLEGLHLVGDSLFPGQSTLATALGGVKLAESLAA